MCFMLADIHVSQSLSLLSIVAIAQVPTMDRTDLAHITQLTGFILLGSRSTTNPWLLKSRSLDVSLIFFLCPKFLQLDKKKCRKEMKHMQHHDWFFVTHLVFSGPCLLFKAEQFYTDQCPLSYYLEARYSTCSSSNRRSTFGFDRIDGKNPTLILYS